MGFVILTQIVIGPMFDVFSQLGCTVTCQYDVMHVMICFARYQVTCCAMSGDGQTIVSGSEDKTVRVWDVTTGQLRHTLEGHSNWVRDGR